MKLRNALMVFIVATSISATAQTNIPATAADYAALAQQSIQDAVTKHHSRDFFAACSNILEAVSLDPTNQNYLVAATTYQDLETRFTVRKELEGYTFAERAIQLSGEQNADAYFHAARALDYIGSPAKAYACAQQALKLGGLSAANEAAAQKIATNSSPRKTILWNALDLQAIKRDGLTAGNTFFYYPVPPAHFFNQTAEYQVFGASRWEVVENDDDTFLKIWPGAQATIEIRIVVSRFKSYRKVIVEDHSLPLPLEIAAFTNSTRFIDAMSPEIQAAAKELKGTNWVETIKGIQKYVNEGWNYVEAGTHCDASSTLLKTRTGNCLDEANLCAALARANGIPTRMVRGYESFVENGKFMGLSEGHFWDESYIPGTGWCEFVDDSAGVGGMPWFCIRRFWQDTEHSQKEKWNPQASLDIAIQPPLINTEMETTKYILWYGMTEKSINQVGTRWHMIKENWQ